MKKSAKTKSAARKTPSLALPPGVTIHKGSTRLLKKWFARPDLETSGGCRTTHGHPISKPANRSSVPEGRGSIPR
jgi:hypothetical protein